MVQAVENRAALSGVVQRVEPAGEGVAITLRVEGVDPVPGVPNLLAGTVGETITVTVPHGGDTPPRPYDRIRCQARLAGPGRYVAVAGTVESG